MTFIIIVSVASQNTDTTQILKKRISLKTNPLKILTGNSQYIFTNNDSTKFHIGINLIGRGATANSYDFADLYTYLPGIIIYNSKKNFAYYAGLKIGRKMFEQPFTGGVREQIFAERIGFDAGVQFLPYSKYNEILDFYLLYNFQYALKRGFVKKYINNKEKYYNARFLLFENAFGWGMRINIKKNFIYLQILYDTIIINTHYNGVNFNDFYIHSSVNKFGIGFDF